MRGALFNRLRLFLSWNKNVLRLRRVDQNKKEGYGYFHGGELEHWVMAVQEERKITASVPHP